VSELESPPPGEGLRTITDAWVSVHGVDTISANILVVVGIVSAGLIKQDNSPLLIKMVSLSILLNNIFAPWTKSLPLASNVKVGKCATLDSGEMEESVGIGFCGSGVGSGEEF
jgi:hypothetical protein